MPSDRTARVTQVSVRRRLSSRERRQRAAYRLALVTYVLVWVAGGIAIEWPSTAECLGRPQESRVLSSAFAAADAGVLETARACLLEPALDLLLWTLAGTAIGLVVYYLLRRPR